MVNRSVLIFALTIGSAITALAQQAATEKAEKPEPPAARAQVLVLGVYHMANPGRDDTHRSGIKSVPLRGSVGSSRQYTSQWHEVSTCHCDARLVLSSEQGK